MCFIGTPLIWQFGPSSGTLKFVPAPLKGKNKFLPFNYEFGQRSQDLEPLFFENGLLYITNSESILNGEILAGNNFPLIVNHPYSQVDIDTEEDFKFAEYILENHPNE